MVISGSSAVYLLTIAFFSKKGPFLLKSLHPDLHVVVVVKAHVRTGANC